MTWVVYIAGGGRDYAIIHLLDISLVYWRVIGTSIVWVTFVYILEPGILTFFILRNIYLQTT